MKLKMAVLSPLPHNYTWHTAEHRKQRFEVRASTPSAKSTLMMNSNLVPRAFPLYTHLLREKPWGRGWIKSSQSCEE